MADNIIDELNIEIKANANSANSALGELLKKMNALDSSLSRLNGSSLQGLASGVAQLSHSMSAFNSSGVKTKDFTRIATGLNKLGNVNVQGVSDASRAISTLTSNLYNIGTIKFDAQGLTNLTNAISSLGRKTVTQATSNIPLLTQTLTKLINELNKLEQVKFDTQGLANLVSSISKLGGKSVTNSIPNISSLSRELKKLLQMLSSAPNINKNIVLLINSLATLSKGSSKLKTSLQGISKEFANTETSSKNLGSQLTNLYAKFLALKGATLGLGNSIKRSMDFLETVNFFEVAMEKVGKDSANKWKEMGYESAEAYANSFSERAKQLTVKMTGFEIDTEGNAVMLDIPNLGIEPESVLNAQAIYAQMANSIGLIGETSLNTSKALTMLGADWASLRNISFDSAWDKFRSALAGETEAVRALGIDITQATLAQYAYRYGLTQSIYEMDRATKTQLSLIAMLDQSRVAWGDLANTLNSPSNQLRILQNNMVSLSRTIGNLFIPILTKVLPYINGFIIALQRLFQWIGSLLGIKFSSINSAIGGMKNNIGGVGDGVKDLNDSVKDTGSGIDKANKKAKKFKKTLLGFDQLNILNDNSDKTDPSKNAGKGGGAGGIGDIGGGSPILDEAIADLLSEYEKAWDNAFNEMENKANQIANNISDAFKKIWKAAEPARVAVKKLWDEGLSKLGNFTWTALKDFWNNFLKPLGKWTLGKGLPAFLDIINDFLNKIEWETINSSLKSFWSALEPFAESIGTGLIDFYKDLFGVGADFINKTVPSGINSLTKALKKLDPDTVEKIGYSLGALLVSIKAFKGLKGIGKVIGASSPLAKGLSLLATHPYISLAVGIAGVVVALDKFGVIKVNWSSLGKSIKNLFGAISNLAKKIDWKKLSGAIVYFIGALTNITLGIGQGLIDFATEIIELLTPVVASTINLVATAIGGLSKVISSMSPETIKTLTTTLISLLAIWKTYQVASKIVDMADSFKKLSYEFWWIKELALQDVSNVLTSILSVFGGTAKDLYTLAITSIAGSFGELSYEFWWMKQLALDSLKTKLSNFLKVFGSAVKNPYALAITAIATALVLIARKIQQVNKKAEESRVKTMLEELSNTGTLKLSELGQGFVDLANSVSENMQSTIKAIEKVDETKSSIENTSRNIAKIDKAIKLGAFTAKEKIPELKGLFDQLLNDSKNIFDEEYNVIVEGLAGGFGDTLTALGENVPEIVKLLKSVRDKGKSSVEDLKKEMDKLNKSFDKGKISAEEYEKQSTKLWNDFKAFQINTEPIEKAKKAFSDLKETIDTSDFVKNGKFDTTNLNNMLSDMSTAFSTAKTDINTQIDGIKASSESFMNYAKNMKYPKSKIKKFSNLIVGTKVERKKELQELEGTYEDVIRIIERNLLENIPAQIEAAKKDYKKQSYVYRMFHSENEHIEKTMQMYKRDVVDPTVKEINQAFEDAGIECEAKAGKAMGNIINNMFKSEYIESGDYTTLQKTLVDDVGGVVTNAMEEVGLNANEGFVKGLGSDKKSVKTAMGLMGELAIKTIKKNLDIHSPSRVMYTIGQNTTQGLINGINSLKSGIATASKNIIQSFKTLGTKTIEGLRNGWDSVKESKIGKEISKLPTYIKDKAGNGLQYLKEKGTEIATGLRNGWDNVKESKIGKEMAGLYTYVKDKMGNLNEKTKEKGKEIIKGLRNGWDNIKESEFGTEVAKISEYAKGKMGNLTTKLLEKGREIIKGLSSGYSKQYDEKFSKTLLGVGNKIAKGMGSILTNEKIQQKGSDIVGALKKGWDNAKTTLDEWLKTIPEAISKGIGDLKETGGNLMEKFIEGLKSKKIPTFNIKTKTTNTVIEEKVEKKKKSSGWKLKFPFFATGGFPDKGQLFVGNENGIEMMGKMGNKNVVANNKQITDGIKQAVYEAVVQANARTKTTQQQNPIIDNKIYIGAEQIARAVTEGQKKLDRRMNPIATF